MSLKKDIWELIEKEIPNASNTIGWGSMDSLCDNLIDLIENKNHE